MNLSFDINTQEGDKIIVSLSSSYPAFPGIALGFELIEVSIIREKGEGPVKVEVFGKIGQLDILGDGFVLKSEGWTFWVMTRATFGREENHFAEFPAAPEL